MLRRTFQAEIRMKTNVLGQEAPWPVLPKCPEKRRRPLHRGLKVIRNLDLVLMRVAGEVQARTQILHSHICSLPWLLCG